MGEMGLRELQHVGSWTEVGIGNCGCIAPAPMIVLVLKKIK